MYHEETFIGIPGINTSHRHGKGTSIWKLRWRNDRRVRPPSSREISKKVSQTTTNLKAQLANPAW